MRRIMFLANPNSAHTIKWVTSLASEGFEILLFGLEKCSTNRYNKFPNIKIETLNLNTTLEKEGSLKKISYFKALPLIKRLIKKFKPNIIHSHYASSYGLLGALTGFHPFILSVWGSDIYSFPEKSFLHKEIIKFVLEKANVICSTSNAMKQRIKTFTKKDIEVIPFGVDTNIFKPMQIENTLTKSNIIIGTVKSLERIYGIEYLIKAFKIVSSKYKSLSLKLLIVGGGSLESELKNLAQNLGILHKTIFTGKVLFEQVQKYHNMISIFVAASIQESFGVSVLEAMACEKPVIVSNVGGLPEIVKDGITGFVVPPKNPQKTAEAIEKLLLDKDLRIKMGKAGRERVKKLYDWNRCVQKMINIYNKIL